MGRETHKRKNWAKALVVLVVGTIFLGNMFDYITWDIWQKGIYILAAVLLISFLYKSLHQKGWAFKTYQFAMFVLMFGLLTHTILAITQPGYLRPNDSETSEYEYYHKSMELKKEYYEQEFKNKKFEANIESGQYMVTDSIDTSFYFRTHPPRKPNQNISISHNPAEEDLKITLRETNYTLPPMQEILNLYPNIILGSPQIPLYVYLKTTDTARIDMDLKNQKLEEFETIMEGGEINLKFSESSTPRSKFRFVIRDGVSTISLPKEIAHTITYDVREKGNLTIQDIEVKQRGTYSVISSKEENTSEIELRIDGGKLSVKTH